MKIRKAIGLTSLISLSLIMLITVLPFSLPSPEKQVVGSGERADGFRLTLAAIEDVNGPDGQATFVDTFKDAKVKMDIVQISILSTDRLAQLVGVVTSTSGGTFADFEIGRKVTFYVEDNGEGPDSIPDGFRLPTDKVPVEPKPGDSVYSEVIHGNFRVTGIGEKETGVEPGK